MHSHSGTPEHPNKAPGTLTQAIFANLAPWSKGNWSTKIGGTCLPVDSAVGVRVACMTYVLYTLCSQKKVGGTENGVCLSLS
jgi:hypothetical protein